MTLGAFGLERYLDWARGSDERDRHAARLYLWCAAGGMALIALLAQTGILLGLWKSVIYSSMPPAKAEVLDAYTPVLQVGCWIMAVLAVVLAGVWELLANGLAGWRMGLAGVALLTVLDLYRVDRPFVRATELVDQAPDFATLSAPNDVVGFLSARAQGGEVFRALDLAPLVGGGGGNNLNWMALYGIEQLGGHHPNELGRYRDLIGGELPANLTTSNFRLLDLTNTVYLVSPQPIAELRYPIVYQSALGNGVIYRNPNALPRAFLVGKTEVVPDANAVARLLSPGFDARAVATLPAPLPAGRAPQPDPRGQVAWARRSANEQTLGVVVDRPALLVVTDNFYEAWHAELDGTPVPLLRADYTFRAVPVPAGSHIVRFYYHSGLLNLSVWLSVVLQALLLVVALGGWLLGRRRRAATPASAGAAA